MKVLGVCGSPRRGNTEWMLRTLLRGASEGGAETELILLREKNIKGCDGCLSCESGGKYRQGLCQIQDDMPGIYTKLLESDVLVFGTPVYFEMLSGLLKNFMDRTCPIWPKLAGKRLAGIAVAEEGIGQAIENLKTYGSICDMQWVGGISTLAKTPGDAAQNKDLAQELAELGRKLISL